MKPHIALIGLGLIGSSLARALKKKELADGLSGTAASPETRARVRELGLLDTLYDNAPAAVAKADIVFLCVPQGSVGDVARAVIPAMREGAVLTDVGSVKASVAAELAPLSAGRVHLVPGHPIAGTEFSGPDAGFAELFEGRWCILTPAPETPLVAVEAVADLWRHMGSEVAFMDAAEHDLTMAMTSHLPHLVAYNLVATAMGLEGAEAVVKYSAGGFRDFTRIAASDPVMWRDIFLHNRESVLEVLDRFSGGLEKLRAALEAGDGAYLHDLFSKTREVRRSIVEAGQDIAAPDFGRRGSGNDET